MSPPFLMFSVHQHWDPLKVCAVGRSYPPEFYSYIKDARVRNVFEKIAQETEEDYQKLISKLEEFGVDVVRTDISDDHEIYRTGTSVPTPPMCPRDFTAMIGSEFFMPSEKYGDDIDVDQELRAIQKWSSFDETYKVLNNSPELTEYLCDLFLPGRAVELSPSTVMKLRNSIGKIKSINRLMKIIGKDNLEKLIIQARTNTIGSNNKFPNFKEYYAFESIRNKLLESGNKITYDKYVSTANVTRVGKDLYHSLGNIVNLLTRERCEENANTLFPDYRNHTLSIAGHSDGNFCPVKPGLIVSIRDESHYTETFPDWEVVYLEGQSWYMLGEHLKHKKKVRGRYWVPGEENNDAFHDYISDWYNHWVIYSEETVFDVNMLVIDEKNVICNNENEQVFEAFERHGITPHVIIFRHRYFWDGGLHCITSDLHRDGTRQDYFPDREVDQ